MTLSVRVLGARSPYPIAGSPCSGYLVEASDALVLVELGLAVWPALLQQADPSSLAAIWISHLHPDHSGDLLAAYQWAANTEGARRLSVYGPPGWAERVGACLPIPDGPEQFRRLFDVHEHGDDDTARLGNLTLAAVPVQHSVPTWGLRVTHDGATLAYSGDSGPCSALGALGKGAQLFICEAGAAESGGQWHCSPEEVAHTIQDSRRLVLTHLAPGLSAAHASRRANGARVAVPGKRFRVSR